MVWLPLFVKDVRLRAVEIGPAPLTPGQKFSHLSSSYSGPCSMTHDKNATAIVLKRLPDMFGPLIMLKHVMPSLILAIPIASASACPRDNSALLAARRLRMHSPVAANLWFRNALMGS